MNEENEKATWPKKEYEKRTRVRRGGEETFLGGDRDFIGLGAASRKVTHSFGYAQGFLW